MKVVVLGAGVVGVMTAYYLGMDGHQVTLVDAADEVGTDASAANAGFLAPNDSFSWASPRVPWQLAQSLLGRATGLGVRLGRDLDLYRWGLRFLRECTPARSYRASVVQMRLAKYSQVVQRQIEDAEDIDYAVTRRGAFYLYRDAADLGRAARRMELFRQHGIEQRLVGMDEVVSLEPALGRAKQVFVGGIYGVSDASGDCAAFTRALADRCVRRFGARLLLRTSVRGLVAEGVMVRTVRTNDGDLAADAYVMCLGVGSARVARSVGVRLPIYPVKGYSATFPIRDAGQAPTMPAVEQSTLIAWSRLGDRVRMSSTAELVGYDRAWQPSNVYSICAMAREIFPAGLDLDAGRFRACLRPMTADGPPVLGVGRHHNLVYNTGHGHLGWTMAAGSGRVAADLVGGTSPAIDLAGLRPRGWVSGTRPYAASR